MAKDTRELYLDKHVKTKDGQPLKRWISPIGFANLSAKDKSRLIKSSDTKKIIPNEFENKSNQQEDRQGNGNVRKRSQKAKSNSEDSGSGEGQDS